MKPLVLIIYTTLYKKGGEQFKMVAETMASEKKEEGFSVECEQVESKADVTSLFNKIRDQNKQIQEFHFVGHSGMYGPMFGTVSFPEQFSPFEIKSLQIPFAKDANAIFHSCRTARWFAPYFAQVQQVNTSGYHWYTTFSSQKFKFSHPSFSKNTDKLYLFGSPGRKSHGLYTTIKKRMGFISAEKLKPFSPTIDSIDASYNNVAELYANTFKDIKVRRDEFDWIVRYLPKKEKFDMLDIGCGNGALLHQLANKLSKGVGVDASENLLSFAKKLNSQHDNIKFTHINDPVLPFDNDSFDVIVSLLSLRYLDWDPIFKEINRVLRKDGKLIIIDMVTAPLSFWEITTFLKGKLNHYLDRRRFPEFYKNLQNLVAHKDWAKMLNYNPIRSQHEMVNFLKSRYPSCNMKVINIGLHSRVIAFEATQDDDIG
jgi:ubiquinone/menaquinone biosynthesis C-methylase UbiE